MEFEDEEVEEKDSQGKYAMNKWDEDGLWFGDIEAENDDWFMMDALSPSRAPSLSIEREREGREGREREGETEGGERGWRDLLDLVLGGERWKYYLPIASWLPKYSSVDLPSDLIAGLVVATLLIPQGIAYAIIAQLPANYGLWASVVPVFVYVIFGTCPQLAVGPEGVVSMILLEVVIEITKEECEGGICTDSSELLHSLTSAMFTLSFLCGILCLLCGLIRAGFFGNIISKPILNGFVSASALIIFGSQLHEFFGFCVDPSTCPSYCLETGGEGIETYILIVQKIFHASGCTNWYAVLIGSVSILLFVLIELVKKLYSSDYPHLKLFPTTFVIILGGILFGNLFELGPIRVLGEIDSGPPPLSYPTFSIKHLRFLVPYSVLLVLVGFVEATAVAKTYGGKHQYSVSPNRELIAFGMCNFVGSFFSAYPVFSSLPRSNIADLAGARTTLTGLVAAAITLFCVSFAMPLFQNLPYAVVSGVIMCAAILLVEYHDILYLLKIQAWKEFTLALLVFLMTFLLGPSLGIAATLGISIYFVVKRSASLVVTILDEEGNVLPPNQPPPNIDKTGISIIRIEEPIHFGNSTRLLDSLRRIQHFGAPKIHPGAPRLPFPVKGFLIDMKGVTHIDPEGVSVFREMLTQFKKRKVYVFFVGMNDVVQDYLVLGGVIGGRIRGSEEREKERRSNDDEVIFGERCLCSSHLEALGALQIALENYGSAGFDSVYIEGGEERRLEVEEREGEREDMEREGPGEKEENEEDKDIKLD